MMVDGERWDLDRVLPDGATVRFIRAQDEAALPILRHDCAHVMAEAVQDLYPGTQVTIGPPVEDGFYYDFARNEPFHPEDLERIEARMAEIVAADKPFRREVVSREDARRRFEAQGEHYKVELLDDIPEGEPITLYHQDGWFDLCRGPHGPSTGRIGAFKLLKVAGAYWRGDSRNAMLQRIYGTAWPTRKQLDEYLHRLQEAERRDHRRLGKALDLFHFQEEAAGSAFWHPKGWILYRAIEAYVRRRLDAAGYVEVRTPQLLDRTLWEASGHWEKFGEHMFVLEAEHKTLALEADELPGACADLQPAPAQLPRSAAAHGRVRVVSPQRAVRRPARPDAGARVHPGRRPHLLHARADHRGDDRRLRSAQDRSIATSASTDVFVRFADRPPVRAGSDEIWDRAEQALGRRRRLPGSRPSSIPAKARSMGRSSSSSCATRSAASGSAAPIRSTSCCPSG